MDATVARPDRPAGAPLTLDEVVELARTAHEGQVDKIGEPYIRHPMRVMERMDAGDDRARMVAVLHDVIEDTPLTAEGLVTVGVPPEVVEAVQVLTHAAGEPNEAYWRRIRAHPLARRVKLADIADNSDPTRMAPLEPDVRARLEAKYRDAVRTITAGPDAPEPRGGSDRPSAAG